MKLFAFEKYEGAGNDFIIVDFFDYEFLDLNDEAFMNRLCDRHFGIGADGIMALCKEEGYDFRMKYLNSDGRFSTFCGNGSRCISLYAKHKWGKSNFHFIAADGPHDSEVLGEDHIKVKMKSIETIIHTDSGPLVQSGSPHLIFEVFDAFQYNVREEGKRIRNQFSIEGANVNFIQITGDKKFRISTYERGVEDETLACGTGIVASAYYYARQNKLIGLNQIEVEAKGGQLRVLLDMDSDGKASNVYLIGPARKVFSGFWEA